MEANLNVEGNVWHLASAGDLSTMPAMAVAGYTRITGIKQLPLWDPTSMNTPYKSDQLLYRQLPLVDSTSMNTPYKTDQLLYRHLISAPVDRTSHIAWLYEHLCRTCQKISQAHQ